MGACCDAGGKEMGACSDAVNSLSHDTEENFGCRDSSPKEALIIRNFTKFRKHLLTPEEELKMW